MPTIRIDGFYNLNKVGMTKAINGNLGLNLADSKAITDKLLREGFVTIDVTDMETANALVAALKIARANVQIV